MTDIFGSTKNLIDTRGEQETPNTTTMELVDLPNAPNDQIKNEFMDFSADTQKLMETNTDNYLNVRDGTGIFHEENGSQEKNNENHSATVALNDFPNDQIKKEFMDFSAEDEEIVETNVKNESYIWNDADYSDNAGKNDHTDNDQGTFNIVENICAVCEKSFSIQRELIKHVQENHPRDRGFKCRYCTTLYSTFNAVYLHHKKIHRNLSNMYSCEYCSKSFFKKPLFLLHKLTHPEYATNSDTSKTNEISNKTSELDESNNKNINPIDEKCGICRKTCSSIKALVKHVNQTHPNDNAFKCIKCPLLFPTIRYLRRHYKVKHSRRRRDITCDICGMTYYSISHLKKHQLVHKRPLPFSCNKCDKMFEYKSNLLDHKKTHLGENNKSKNVSNNIQINNDIEIKCAICKKEFSSLEDLIKHVKQTHPNHKAFKCRHCPSLFSNPLSVYPHLKRCHADLVNLLFCNYCNKSYFTKDLLDRHKLIHIQNNSTTIGEQKNYPIENKCGICKEEFSLQGTLIKHVIQSHPNDNAFKCLYCSILFSNVRSAETHYEIKHIGGTILSCNRCDKSFKYKSNWLKHKKNCLNGNDKSYDPNNVQNLPINNGNEEEHIKIEIVDTDDDNNLKYHNSIETYNDSANCIPKKVLEIEKKCSICEKEFSLQVDLVQHVEQAHPNDKAFKCPYCPKRFLRLFAVYPHLKRSHADLVNIFSCDYCSRTFLSEELLDRHRLIHTHGISSETSKTKIYTIENKCAICSKEFPLQKYLVQHVIHAHPNDKAFKCILCPTLFSKIRSAGPHYVKQHSKMTKKYHKEKHKPTLLKHMKSHLGNNDKLCNTNTLRLNHIDEEHCENDKKNLFNEYDGSGNRDDQGPTLANHNKNNNSQLLHGGYYEMEEQNSSADNNYDSEYQNKISGLKDEAVIDHHECNACAKVFKCKQSIAKHMQHCHPEIDLFKCQYCDDFFYSLESLSLHVTVVNHLQKPDLKK